MSPTYPGKRFELAPRFSSTNAKLSIKLVSPGVDQIPLIICAVQTPSTPIDFSKKIWFDLKTQFCVDHIELAHLSFHRIRVSPSSDSFGVVDTSNPMAREFLDQSNLQKAWNNYQDLQMARNNFHEKACWQSLA